MKHASIHNALGANMITDNLIDRLNAKAARGMADKVRAARRHALLSISRCCIVVTDDGRETRELIFDHPPTIGQLSDRIGPDAWVVSDAMRRVPHRARQRSGIAAE